MTFCPKCDDHEDGEIQWHRRCALVAATVLKLEALDAQAYRHYPKE